ncbi:MAG: hypothetical protein RLZZ324_284 [Candidatus Parcubacteria bacterium]
MSVFEFTRHINEIYTKLRGSSHETKLVLRGLWNQYKRTGAVALGYWTDSDGKRGYHWLVLSPGTITAAAQADHIIRNTPVDAELVKHKIF